MLEIKINNYVNKLKQDCDYKDFTDEELKDIVVDLMDDIMELEEE